MKISLIEKKDNFCKFVIDEVDVSFMNSLRRIAVTGVPTSAIEEVDFSKNSSVLYDEILAHRLGLVPLKTDLKTYKFQDSCKCKGKGCSFCQTTFKLNAKGPKVVYSGELKSSDPKVVPAYDKIPIVNLLEGQELKLVARAVLGYGREHSKWSTGLLTYHLYPKISISNVKKPEIVVESCPRKVFEIEKEKLKIKNPELCNLCLACVEDSKGEVSVSGEPNKFIVSVESWGQHEPVAILENACDYLEKRIKSFQGVFEKCIK